jgi:hypothetical protein
MRAAKSGLNGRDPRQLDGKISRAIRANKVVALLGVGQTSSLLKVPAF